MLCIIDDRLTFVVTLGWTSNVLIFESIKSSHCSCLSMQLYIVHRLRYKYQSGMCTCRTRRKQMTRSFVHPIESALSCNWMVELSRRRRNLLGAFPFFPNDKQADTVFFGGVNKVALFVDCNMRFHADQYGEQANTESNEPKKILRHRNRNSIFQWRGNLK